MNKGENNISKSTKTKKRIVNVRLAIRRINKLIKWRAFSKLNSNKYLWNKKTLKKCSLVKKLMTYTLIGKFFKNRMFIRQNITPNKKYIPSSN